MQKSVLRSTFVFCFVFLVGGDIPNANGQQSRHAIELLADYDQDRLEAIERWMALGREGANALISPRKRRTLGSSQKGAASRGFSVVRRSVPEEGDESSSVMALASITDVSWEEDDEGTVYPDSFTTYFDYAGSLDSVYGYWAEAWYEDGVFIEDTGEELTVIRDDGFPLYYRDGGMIQEDGEIVEWWNFEETTRSYDNVLEIIGVESNSEWEGLDTMYVDRLIYESDDSLRYVLVDDDYPFEFLLVNSGNNLVATVEEADGVDFILIWYNTSFQELFSNSGDQAVTDFSDGLLYENGDTLFTTIERSEPTSYGFLTTTLRLTDEAFEAGTSAPEDYYVDGLLHTYIEDGLVDSTKAEWMCFDEEGPTGEFCDGDSVYFTYASFNIATHNETQQAARLGSGEVIGYPNPTAAKVVFEVPNTRVTWHGLEVYDLLGKRVLSLQDEDVEMSSTTITIDVGTLANGVYFLRFGSEEGLHTGRFVVLR